MLQWKTACGVLAVAIIVVSSLVTASSQGNDSKVSEEQLAAQSLSGATSTLSNSSINSTVAQAYATLARMGLDPVDGAASVESQIASGFERVLGTADFTRELSSARTSGLQLSLSLSRDGVSNAIFEFQSQNALSANTTYWNLDLATNSIVGPVTSSQQSVSLSTYTQDNWAGWSYWGGGTPQLTSLYSDTEAVAFVQPGVAPSNVPQGDHVEAAGAAWIGLTGKGSSTCGSYGLLQVGYIWVYGGPAEALYQFAPCMDDADYFSPAIDVAQGDLVYEYLNESATSPNTWYITFFDFTTYEGATVTFNVANYVSSWKAYYTNLIVEAPGTLFSSPSQIAQFNSSVNFYDVEFWSTANMKYTSYNMASNSNIYQLNQYGGDNTHQIYDDAYGGVYDDYGYPTVSWVNSNFNWDYVF
jgi:hypothetical protein